MADDKKFENLEDIEIRSLLVDFSYPLELEDTEIKTYRIISKQCSFQGLHPPSTEDNQPQHEIYNLGASHILIKSKSNIGAIIAFADYAFKNNIPTNINWENIQDHFIQSISFSGNDIDWIIEEVRKIIFEDPVEDQIVKFDENDLSILDKTYSDSITSEINSRLSEGDELSEGEELRQQLISYLEKNPHSFDEKLKSYQMIISNDNDGIIIHANSLIEAFIILNDYYTENQIYDHQMSWDNIPDYVEYDDTSSIEDIIQGIYFTYCKHHLNSDPDFLTEVPDTIIITPFESTLIKPARE